MRQRLFCFMLVIGGRYLKFSTIPHPQPGYSLLQAEAHVLGISTKVLDNNAWNSFYDQSTTHTSTEYVFKTRYLNACECMLPATHNKKWCSVSFILDIWSRSCNCFHITSHDILRRGFLSGRTSRFAKQQHRCRFNKRAETAEDSCLVADGAPVTALSLNALIV